MQSTRTVASIARHDTMAPGPSACVLFTQSGWCACAYSSETDPVKTPLNASRVGGLQYTVEDEQSGLLFPEGDWRLLSECIRETIENRRLNERLVKAALVRVKQYSWPRIARKILSFFHSLEIPKKEGQN